ncbi:MAG TPA: SRPBCC family protein [Longimicrobiaceae bacterium]|nr:SRPBCC family protein [Longimicrobiaceae bacterium]
MKWLLVAGLVVVALVAIVFAVGMMLPVGHTASRTAQVSRPPGEVWALLATPERFPAWRSGIKSATSLQSEGRWSGWREEGKFGPMAYALVEADAPRRLVARVEGEKAFGGTWTYLLEPVDGGATRLTITEDGEVYSPLFRFMSRFVFGHHATIDQYLRDVQAAPAGAAIPPGTPAS